jgi:two-component system response regulator HydG
MINYPWRGNIRELENLVKRAIIKTAGDTITSLELPTERTAVHPSGEPAAPADLSVPFKEYLNTIVRDAEEKYLVRLLRLHKGNINQIAKLMNVDRKTVYRKMADYSIDPSAYRNQAADS